LFGGKELQTELDLGWSDFGVRCLDTWNGKWLGVDILAEAKPHVSPYTYGLGNPIRFSDPSGMIEEDQDGLMSVSTSLWGRDVTGGENSGEVLNEKFLSEGQLARDTDTYTFNDSGSPSPSLKNAYSKSLEALADARAEAIIGKFSYSQEEYGAFTIYEEVEGYGFDGRIYGNNTYKFSNVTLTPMSEVC